VYYTCSPPGRAPEPHANLGTATSGGTGPGDAAARGL